MEERDASAKSDSNKENELPRKILDIPSSDDDTTQVRTPDRVSPI
jgi:hypothetical protein